MHVYKTFQLPHLSPLNAFFEFKFPSHPNAINLSYSQTSHKIISSEGPTEKHYEIIYYFLIKEIIYLESQIIQLHYCEIIHLESQIIRCSNFKYEYREVFRSF